MRSLWTIAITCALLLLGYGDSSEAASSSESSVTSDAQLEKLADLYIWPASSGLTRDKPADIQQCKEQVDQNPELKTKRSLIKVHQHMVCMQELGWKVSKANPKGE